MAAERVSLVELFPEADVDLINTMVEEDEAGAISWETIDRGPRTEAHVFKASYLRIAQSYIAMYGAENGRIILNLFKKYEPVVDLFARFVLKSDKTVGKSLNAKLVGETATGASQAFLRPLTLRSFQNASYTHLPTATGAYNLLPTTTGNETAEDGKQAWVILGFLEPLVDGLIPYDEIQVQINDTIGTRKPMYPYINFSAQVGRNLKVFECTTPYFVQPSQELNIDITVRTANIQFGLFPLGVDIITADSTRATGPIA